MNRKIYILIHIVGWLAFFCSPMMFIDHSSNIDMLRYLFFSMMPFVLMVVFAKYRKGGRYVVPTATTNSTMALKFHSKQNHHEKI